MLQSPDDFSSDTAVEGYDMEFKSSDDAWYTVQVLLEGETLRVKYENFSEDHDNVFFPENFKSGDELNEFVRRFRKVSAQLQDAECTNVVKGMRVCASLSTQDDDCRFYDAIVDDVLPKKHSYKKGQEECECTFLVYWLHGPSCGNETDRRVADICLLQDSKLHPKLACFREIARQKIEKGLCNLACDHVSQHKTDSPIIKQKRNFAERLRRGKFARRSLSEVWPSQGGTEVSCDVQDADVGGGRNPYIILVENLERELSPSVVSEFIREKTSLATRVYIFPSLQWEPYTKGLIMLHCKKDLEQLLGFLQHPDHFIVSSNGRPWVATAKMSLNDSWTLTLESPIKFLNKRGSGFSNKLTIVYSGTEEFKKAKELREIILEFLDHQQGLFKKLVMEERSIQ